jgi:1,4-dihydroxy-2-naphthoyl-CoA hydrolase
VNFSGDARAVDPGRLEAFLAAGRECLPGLLGIEIVDVDGSAVRAAMEVVPRVMAPHGYLHGGTVVALADTACGYGCWLGLPAGSPGFTTLELKTNFIGTAREGVVTCDARRVHGGRTTEIWDAEVAGPDGRTIALFRCTQLILQPRPATG